MLASLLKSDGAKMKIPITILCLSILSSNAIAFAREGVAPGATETPTKKSAKTKSAKKSKMTEARAVAIVEARSEVKEFVSTIKKSGMKGSTSHVEFDRKEGDDFVIHVYQYVPDDAETGHTATMNWYHVNGKTGKVTTEF